MPGTMGGSEMPGTCRVDRLVRRPGGPPCTSNVDGGREQGDP